MGIRCWCAIEDSSGRLWRLLERHGNSVLKRWAHCKLKQRRIDNCGRRARISNYLDIPSNVPSHHSPTGPQCYRYHPSYAGPAASTRTPTVCGQYRQGASGCGGSVGGKKYVSSGETCWEPRKWGQFTLLGNTEYFITAIWADYVGSYVEQTAYWQPFQCFHLRCSW